MVQRMSLLLFLAAIFGMTVQAGPLLAPQELLNFQSFAASFIPSISYNLADPCASTTITLTCSGPSGSALISQLVYNSGGASTVSTQLGLLTNLQSLTLFGGYGTIPTQIGFLTNLTSLALHGSFSSTPTQLRLLTKLTFLDIQSSTFSGTIPADYFTFSNLQNLYLTNSGFSGPIPTQIGLLTNLSGLFIQYNPGITGTIPTQIGLLTKLTQLYLNANTLVGSIPTQFGLLTKLYALHLETNALSGPIPTEFSALTVLSELNLSKNQLYGSISSQLNLLPKLTTLFLTTNCFSSPITNYTTAQADYSVYSRASNCPCVNGLPLSATACSCYSGYTGTLCENLVNNTCSIPAVDPLRISGLPEFSSGSVSKDTLSFQVLSPARSGRVFTKLQFSPSGNCSYPGNNFNKDFTTSNCSDVYNAAIPIVNIVNDCLFVRTNDSINQYYDGTLSIALQELVTTAKGNQVNRTLGSSLLLRLTLPSTIQLQIVGNITVQPLPLEPLDVAVSGQIYDRSTDTATINITSFFTAAYQLLAPTVTLPSNLLAPSATVSIPGGSCSYASYAGAGVKCIQVTTLVIRNVTKMTCKLDGDYVLNWSYQCQTGFNTCALDQPKPVNASFRLSSNDLCGKLEVKAQLSGSLQSYADAAFTQVKTAFIAGNVSYYQLNLTSDVSIQSNRFLQVALQSLNGNANPIIIWDGTSLTQKGIDAGLVITGTQPGTSASFYFYPKSTIFGELPSATVAFTVQVTTSITYKTTFGARKRDIQIQTMTFSRSSVLLPAEDGSATLLKTTTPEDVNTTSYFSDMLPSLPTCLFLVLIVAFVLRKNITGYLNKVTSKVSV